MIHSTAIIHDGAKIGTDVKIGPFCIVGGDTVLGNRVELMSHVIIDGKTEIDDDTVVFPFAVIGAMGQDRKFQEENTMTGTKIGKRCKLREYVTIQSGTPASTGTEIGDDCQIMVNAHIGHDCKIGNNVVMSNLVQVAGHVTVEDNAILSAGSMILQFVRIGRNAFIGGMAGIANDVVPYSIYDGTPRASYRTINRIGLARAGFSDEDMRAIHSVYSVVFEKDSAESLEERLKKIRKTVKNNQYAMDAIDFIENRSDRGLTPNLFYNHNAKKRS